MLFKNLRKVANCMDLCIIDLEYLAKGDAALQVNENKLIERASGGDPAAFNRLMEMHEKRMYAVALRMCGNREDAQDCLQEAMLRVYRAIGSFKGQSSFGTWVYRITMNTCLDELRRKKNKQSTSLDNMLDQGWSPTDDSASPEKKVMQIEMRKSISKSIQELPEDMRSAVIMRDIHGYSYDEIADMLNVNVGTIKSRISRGREKLREKLSNFSELFGTNSV